MPRQRFYVPSSGSRMITVAPPPTRFADLMECVSLWKVDGIEAAPAKAKTNENDQKSEKTRQVLYNVGFIGMRIATAGSTASPNSNEKSRRERSQCACRKSEKEQPFCIIC